MAAPLPRWAFALALTALGCAPEGGSADPDRPVADGAVEADGSTAEDGGVDPAPDADLTLDAGPRPDGDLAPDAAAPDAAVLPPGAPPRCPEVQVNPPPGALGLDPFYTQHVDVRGVPLIGGPDVPEAAFRVAAYVLERFLADRPCVRVSWQAAGIRFGIMGPNDVTTDMPEYSDFYEAFPGTDWDTRGRGFGATWERPLTTGDVANLLQSRQDPWFGENIFLHEVAHSFFEFGVEAQPDGPAARERLQALYADAMAAGRWADTYAATNANEYWAEAVQSYANNNLSADPPNGVHNSVDTRDELWAYDPDMAAFIAAQIGDSEWPAYCEPDGAGPAWVPPPIPAAECPQREAFPPDVGCDLADLRSARSDVSVPLTVINQRLTPLSLTWVDFEGRAQPFAELRPRSRVSLQTFETHGWRLLDADGACHSGFVAADQPTRFVAR